MATMRRTVNPFDDPMDRAAPADSSKFGKTPAKTNPFDGPTSPAPASNPGGRPSAVNPFASPTAPGGAGGIVDNFGGDNNSKDSYGDDDEGADEGNSNDFDTTSEIGSGAPVEASWQYLGDLPYRRLPVYSNVRWGGDDEDDDGNNEGPSGGGAVLSSALNYGLSAFPRSALQRHPNMLNPLELRELLNSSTVTKVVGCKFGGPLASVTLPIVGETSWFSQTEIRILTSAGRQLAKIAFPSQGLERKYTPADIITLGFTDRMTLVVVLRDSLCLTYDVKGEAILPPFHILPKGEGKGLELLHAAVFEGGAAALSLNKDAAIVELLDEHDDPAYYASAHIGARQVLPRASASSDAFGFGSSDSLPPHCGLVTYLPTAAFASENFLSYASIAVLPRTRTASKHPEIFLSTTDNSVVVVDAASTNIKDLNCRARISSPIVEMTFAPNGRFLACFTESSMLTVISTTFETKVLDFDTSEGSSLPPLEMKWCGEDSVVLHWKNLGVLMVGPYGDWLRFPYEDVGSIYLIPEMDCCRVITDISVEILQRVPPATALLLRIGSIEPSAMLLDAADAFEKGSAASDEAARAITKSGMLREAIETCTDAAAREFDIATQKRLLRAASYGMHFSFKDINDSKRIMGGDLAGTSEDAASSAISTMPALTTTQFVETSRKLRILNALRHPSVGLLLTSAQYDAISPTGVIARVIAIKRPALATSISKYLHLPKAIQLHAKASKAAAFVSKDTRMSDAEVAQGAIQIINQSSDKSASYNLSSSVNRGGYSTVALAASRAGRPGVAKLLLVMETSIADKVPALIATGAYADAVTVATSARDADLLFYSLLEFQKISAFKMADPAKANQAFFGTVVSKFTPEGFHSLRRYLNTMPDSKSVMGLLLIAQKFSDCGITIAKRTFQQKLDGREKIGTLAEASRIFAMGKDSTFQKACTDDYMDLLKDQEILRTKYGSIDVAPESSSITETISSLLRFAGQNERDQHRLLADADKVSKKFKLPEKVLWHAKVKAFAETNQWGPLRNLANSKAKPPIGFKPFARAAIKARRSTNEVAHYIERVTIPEDRYSLFCEAAQWKRALEEAVKLKDERRVIDVKARCNSTDLQMLADEMLARLA